MYKFKAIETLYSGCRFRSRLEARWAVFFDALGITWEYEKEGYELEGIRYLPDFWLPEQDCFVEIKGQEPSEEEKDKARNLALYTEKNVCIFYGAVDFPELAGAFLPRVRSFIFYPPSAWKFLKSEVSVGGYSSTHIKISLPILSLMQHLYTYNLSLFVNDLGSVVVGPTTTDYLICSIDHFVDNLALQEEGLLKYRSTIESLEDDIREALTLDYQWKLHFSSQSETEDECALWMECTHCGKFDITFSLNFSHRCNGDDETEGRFDANTPRLLKAYTAARSARFEFGEKGKWHGKH